MVKFYRDPGGTVGYELLSPDGVQVMTGDGYGSEQEILDFLDEVVEARQDYGVTTQAATPPINPKQGRLTISNGYGDTVIKSFGADEPWTEVLGKFLEAMNGLGFFIYATDKIVEDAWTTNQALVEKLYGGADEDK